MVKFNTIGQIEKEYVFEDATVETDIVNGVFGEVTDGKFTVKANAVKAVMQVEVGDDAGLDEYKIPSGSHVRVADLSKLDGKTIEVYGVPTVVVGDKLVSKADGTLEVSSSATAPYFEVTKLVYAGARLAGVEATVVAE